MDVARFRLEAGAEPLPGYTLDALLGRGGFGEVWRATAPGGFQVALKFLAVSGEEGSRELAALRFLVNLRDSNLLSLHGVWKLPGFHLLAMELADGTLMDRLKECLKQGLPGIPRDELLRYFRQAAAGIDFLNEPRHDLDGSGPVSIQHGDIKPQNLLIVGSGVKVADFGLLRMLRTPAGSLETGTLTVLYAAPELFSRRIARQSDQYSLAVTWCQLRSGRPPFEGSATEVMAGHLTRLPDLDMLPKGEREVVARALSKTPADRWSTCHSFVEALSRVTVRADLPLPKPRLTPSEQTLAKTAMPSEDTLAYPQTAPRSRAQRSSGALPWIVVAVLATAAVATATLLLTRPNVKPNHLPDERGDGRANTALVVQAKPVGANPSFALVKPIEGEPPSSSVKARGESRPVKWSKDGTQKALELGDGAVVARAAARPQKSPGTVVKRRVAVNSLGMRLVWIEPGTFQMGSPESETGRLTEIGDGMGGTTTYALETRHKVKLTHGYYLGASLVTQAQWQQVMKRNASKFTEGDSKTLPADNVSLEDCRKFCNTLQRLEGDTYSPPTEAEWEYACRAGARTAYCFGDDPKQLTDYAWYRNNSDGHPHPIDEKKPNAWGLYDMQGNLFQWCEDALVPFTKDDATDPKPAREGKWYVLRGGSWASVPELCRAACRVVEAPNLANAQFGFRVVCRQPVLEAAIHDLAPSPEFRPVVKP
jgi:formylglycine-generating enzyme required for sulfatase activity/serine/threonine protein kinase